MKYFEWNEEKNRNLVKERGISFEVVVNQIESGSVLDVIKHYNKDKYPGQNIFVIEYEHYVYPVPFVEDEKKIFLKTIIPSRKYTTKYLKGKSDEIR